MNIARMLHVAYRIVDLKFILLPLKIDALLKSHQSMSVRAQREILYGLQIDIIRFLQEPVLSLSKGLP